MSIAVRELSGTSVCVWFVPPNQQVDQAEES